MMLRILNILILCCCYLIVNAQDKPIKHWTFDMDDSEFKAAMSGTVLPNYADGINKFGIYLDGKNHAFNVNGVDLNDDFTISFWFKPTSVDQAQTIFVQEKIANKTKIVERYLHLFFKNNKIYLKNEKGLLSLKPLDLKDSEWYFITYSYDGFDAKIIMENETIFSTSKVTLYNKMAQRNDYFTIGKNFNGIKKLEAVIDEVKFYNRPIKEEQIKAEATIKPKKDLVELPKIEKDTPKVAAVKPVKKVEDPLNIQPKKNKRPKIKDEFAKSTFAGRKNNLQHEIIVTSSNIEVEVWDYDEYDEDRISIALNNSPFIGTTAKNRIVHKKRKREIYKFNLKSDQVNYLTFIAEDMGIYDSQNTAAVRINVNGKRFDDVYKLTLTKKTNAVLKITHMPINKDKKPIVPRVAKKTDDLYKVVIENEILDPLVVESSDIKLKVKGGQADGRKIKISIENKEIVKPFTINDKVSRNVRFNIGIKKEKILLIEALDLKMEDDCVIELQVMNAGKTIKAYNLQLDQANTILPLIYSPKVDDSRPRNQKVITVSDTTLIFKIKDNSKVDGDIISISQDGQKILSNYLLTGNYKDLDVTIKAKRENNFIFFPVSMGRSKGENTAFIQIISKEEIIHEFSLSSQDKNRPAKLIILHEE